MLRHLFDTPFKTKIGGRVIEIFATSRYESASGARMSVGQPPLPHHQRPHKVYNRFLLPITIYVKECREIVRSRIVIEAMIFDVAL